MKKGHAHANYNKMYHVNTSHKQDTSKVTFNLCTYLQDKAAVLRTKQCWFELHDRGVLADRESTCEYL